MQQHVEAQQGRFERISELLSGLMQESEGMNPRAQAMLEAAVTESALGSEDSQIALDDHGDKAVA